MTKKFAVIGHPVNHSLSPAIHYAFAKQLGFDIEYQKTITGDHLKQCVTVQDLYALLEK